MQCAITKTYILLTDCKQFSDNIATPDWATCRSVQKSRGFFWPTENDTKQWIVSTSGTSVQDLSTNSNYFSTKIVRNCQIILDTPVFKKVLAEISEPELYFFLELRARAVFFFLKLAAGSGAVFFFQARSRRLNFFKLGAGAGFFSSSEPEPDFVISTRQGNPDQKTPL